jgi:hypothetical protein
MAYPDDRNKEIPPLPNEDPTPFYLFGARTTPSRLEKRRRKIREEIERNRRGEHRIPTWVLVVFLVLFVGAWAAWIIFAG